MLFVIMKTNLNSSTAKVQAEKAVSAFDSIKAEAKASNQAEKEAKKALKEAEKEASKEEAGSEAKEALKEAQKAVKKAEAAKAKAEAKEAKAAAEKAEAKEALKEALKAEAEASKSLTIKAEAERKGLNAAVRALLDSAKEASEAEKEALLMFVDKCPDKTSQYEKALESVSKSDILNAYRTFSTFAVTIQDEAGKTIKQVAKSVKPCSLANVYTFEPSQSFNIVSIFRTPASNKRRGRKQTIFEAGKYYERNKGSFVEISKAESELRIKVAKEEEARQAEAKARAEQQAEADRKAGKALREAEAKAKPEA